MFSEIKLAIIGNGKWGFNHFKTSFKLLGKNLLLLEDINETNYDKVSEFSRDIVLTKDIDEILDSTDINSVIISTPAETHYDIAKKCLLNNKHILVEKPITLISSEAKELERISKKNNLVLMVGHVLLYHPAILEMKRNIKEGKIGKLQYIYSNRLNLGTIRSEENILWSFAPHDISLIQFITESYPVEIYARGASFVQPHIEDTTITYLEYPDNVRAHIFVSWLHPFKEHRLVVIGDEGMLVFNDLDDNEKLKFYKKGYNRINGEIEKFDSDYIALNFEEKLPLEEEQRHFFDCILNNKTPRTNGAHAISVLEILEVAQNKIKTNI
jgi:UDP-2-acetamido-3-amino-2,3-dideoxy-glucuronate N-acetyltransferase